MVNFADTDIEPSSNKPKVLETSFVNINCPSATVSTGSMDEDSQLQLVEENERLKAELEQLRIQLTALRGGGGIGRTTVAKRAPQSGPQGQRIVREWENTLRSSLSASEERFSKPDHGGKLVLELPQTSRKSRRQKSTSKRQDEGNSSGTDEDRETVERYIDLEAHESLRGLHHRQNLNIAPPASILIARPPFRAPKLRATSLTHKHSSVKVEVDEKFVQEGALLDKYSDDHRPHGLDDVACQSLLEESIYGCVKERAGWLVGLLILQSMSSFILAQNEALLEEHMVIIRFLTMLVGAGGNAGNQASVRVIRGLATGEISDSNTRFFFDREMKMGLALSGLLGLAGCFRAALFQTPFMETIAITSSLLLIVTISIFLGVLLPLGMKSVRIDPAHSSTTIQVFMDILGVWITVHVSRFVLDSDWSWLIRPVSMSDE